MTRQNSTTKIVTAYREGVNHAKERAHEALDKAFAKIGSDDDYLNNELVVIIQIYKDDE